MVLNDALLTDGALVGEGRTQLEGVRLSGIGEDQFVMGCCSAHRRDFQQLVLPIPADMPVHDRWFNEIAHHLGAAVILDEVLQLYRRHGDNESQWMMSDPGMSRARFLLASGLGDARRQWQVNADVLDSIAQRVEQRRELAGQLAGAPLDTQLARVTERRARLQERIALCSRPRSKRTPAVLRFWLQGGYSSERGVLSALKDAVRP